MSKSFEQSIRCNTQCPHCKSDEVQGGEWTAESREATQQSACSQCGASWTDLYLLVGATDLMTPPAVGGELNRVWIGATTLGDADWKTDYARWSPDKVSVDRILALHAACKEMQMSQARIPMAIRWGPSSDEFSQQHNLSFGECVVAGNSFRFVTQSGHGSIESDLLDIEELETIQVGSSRDIFLGQVDKEWLKSTIRNCGDSELSEAA